MPCKTRKLRQSYIKVRDALHRSGSSADVKKKFKWYDELDHILRTRPTVTPVEIIQNHQPASQIAAPSPPTTQDIFQAEQEQQKSFEKLQRAIQETDERRYCTLHSLQQQHIQMFNQAISSIVNVLSSG